MPDPAPKAVCPHCQRPVATQRSSQCIYCGKALPLKVRPSVKAEEAAEVAAAFAALESGPAPAPGEGFGKWALRFGALGVGALLIFGILGPCMKS